MNHKKSSMFRIEGWDDQDFNLELFVCTDILKLNSLHYGYWQKEELPDINGATLSLADLKKAQELYTRTLIDLIPQDVDTILDVGCGMGDVTRQLADRGHRVTAISPDKGQERFLKTSGQWGIDFYQKKYESFMSNKRFDLILMTESHGYFPMDIGLGQSSKYLNENGYLIVSGIFNKAFSEFFKGGQILDEYLELARKSHFRLETCQDITENVLPTLEYAYRIFTDYFPPLFKALSHLSGKKAALKIKVLKWIFRDEFNRMEAIKDQYLMRLNPAIFEDKLIYVRMVFRFDV